MPLVAAVRQAQADAFKTYSAQVWMSLHTADPSTTGANETSGGAPAYARKQVTWTSGSTGTLTAPAVTFDAKLGSYPYGGFWTASTGGTFLGSQQLAPGITLDGQGTITVTPSYTQS
jgi:hypothetical protein